MYYTNVKLCEIRKKNPEFSFSVLNMQFFDIESVFAASL